MTNQQTDITQDIDPELGNHFTSRRNIFAKAAISLGAMASAPVLMAAASQEVFGAGMPQQVADVLNFALTLEYLESDFYRMGLKSGVIPRRYNATFRTISRHEDEHVAFLKSTLGSAAIRRPEFDFTAGGKYEDVFSNFQTFVTLSQTFEDLGVAAYKGQAGNLMGNDQILTAALRIHSVEARHAAQVRQIAGKAPWDGAFDSGKSKSTVLAAARPFIRA